MNGSPATQIDGIPIANGGNLTMFFSDKPGTGNNNGVVDQIGEQLLGVGFVNQIYDDHNHAIWSTGENGRELTIILDGYVASTIEIEPVGTKQQALFFIHFDQGSARLYSQAARTFVAAATAQAEAIASASNGTSWLNLSASPNGAADTGPVTFHVDGW